MVKASGVGVFDDVLLEGVMAAARPDAIRIFWDVDAPATLAETARSTRTIRCTGRCRSSTSCSPMAAARRWSRPTRRSARAAACRSTTRSIPTTHHPVPADPRFAADLSFLGNRLPDREARVEQFFLDAAARLPERRFLIGGNGWDDKPMPANVRHIGHVYTREHNAFNTPPLAVLNIARD